MLPGVGYYWESSPDRARIRFIASHRSKRSHLKFVCWATNDAAKYHQDIVEVYDLLYQKEGERWIFKASSYPKLRLNQNWVCQQLQELEMQVLQNELINGMICIVAQKILKY